MLFSNIGVQFLWQKFVDCYNEIATQFVLYVSVL
jgi:hypothetical protein